MSLIHVVSKNKFLFTCVSVGALLSASYVDAAPGINFPAATGMATYSPKVKKEPAQKVKVDQKNKDQAYEAAMAKLTPEQRKVVLALGDQLIKKLQYRFTPPNPSLSSPNAMAAKGLIFNFGLGYASHWNGTKLDDGFGVVGASFGDPYRYFSTTVNVDVDSLGLRQDPMAQNTAIGFQFNRYIMPGTSIGVGENNGVSLGSFRTAANSYYATLTQFLPLIIPITLNAGAGTGAYYSAADSQHNVDKRWRPFAGIGVGIYRGLSLITDWTGNEYTVGASYSFKLFQLPFFASAGCANVNNHGGFASHFQAALGFSIPVDTARHH